jgi:hypothetical protein
MENYLAQLVALFVFFACHFVVIGGWIAIYEMVFK